MGREKLGIRGGSPGRQDWQSEAPCSKWRKDSPALNRFPVNTGHGGRHLSEFSGPAILYLMSTRGVGDVFLLLRCDEFDDLGKEQEAMK